MDHGVSVANETAARLCVFDIVGLCLGEAQQGRQHFQICRGLFENDKKFAVAEEEPGGLAVQALLGVLNEARGQAAVLAEVEPGPLQEIGAVLVAEKQSDLVNEYPGALAPLAVGGDTVYDGVQHDQHPHGAELLTQV